AATRAHGACRRGSSVPQSHKTLHEPVRGRTAPDCVMPASQPSVQSYQLERAHPAAFASTDRYARPKRPRLPVRRSVAFGVPVKQTALGQHDERARVAQLRIKVRLEPRSHALAGLEMLFDFLAHVGRKTLRSICRSVYG